MTAPTAIDLSRVAVPDVLEAISHPDLLDGFKTRFLAFWADAQTKDPTLPDYEVSELHTDPAMVTGQAWSYLRLLDRQRVNDGIRALLAPLAKGTNLDNIVAARNIVRLQIAAATVTADAIYEDDIQLLRRYLLSFGIGSAGSRELLLFKAWSAWPEMLAARVNGHKVHGRRGDTDVVVIGPDGELPSEAHMSAVRTAVTADDVRPEAISISAFPATRLTYRSHQTIFVPPGPDPNLVLAEAKERVRKAAATRMIVGGEVPAGLLKGAAFGENVLRVMDHAPVAITADPYVVPILNDNSMRVVVEA